MRYNLNHLLDLNFNLDELKSISKTNADILLAFYLHLNYGKELVDLHKAVEELALDEYPQLDWEFYTIKEYNGKVTYSNFKCLNSTSYLKHLDVLSSSLPDKDKVAYLELVSLCPVYSNTKFVPVTNVPQMLQLHGLVRVTNGGLILTKER